MSGIVELLKAFDRKERAWLVRMALKPAVLDKGFLDKVSEALDLNPQLLYYAWWGMDYHIDWLAAALHAFETGRSVNELTKQDAVARLPEDKITHSIEDFDFIIANDHRIILIEAKAFGGWGNAQINSKLGRLKLISKSGFVTRHNDVTGKPRTIQLHFVLTSISEPEKLALKGPAWALKKDSEGRSPAWFKLDIEPGQFLRVARSDAAGVISENGTLWKIAEARTIAKV